MKARVTNGPATFFMAPTAVLLTYHEVYEKGVSHWGSDFYILFQKFDSLIIKSEMS